MRKILLLSALALIFPVASQAKTLDDLLAQKGAMQNQMSAASSTAAAKVYWNKGTRLEFPDTGFSTSVFTQIQTRYEFTDNDGAGNTSGVDVRVARLGVEGHALNREFSYYVRTELAGSAASLLEAWISWDACDMATVKMGQFKSAVSRQFNTDEVQLQFADRSVVSNHFDLGRQGGIEIKSDAISGVHLTGQFLNGDAVNTVSADTDHAFVLAARIPLTGEIDAFSESDVENTSGTAADIGAAYAYAKRGETDFHTVNADLNVKSEGMSLNGEFFWNDNRPTGATNSNTIGGYVQAGYFLTPKEWEVAARYGIVNCDSNGGSVGGITGGFNACTGNDKVNEASASLNYYWWAHHLKGQVGYSVLNQNTLADQNNNTNRWLVQLSGWF